MHFQPTIRRGLRAAILAIASLMLAIGLVSSAQAKAKDANHDGLPDRWEKRHHLTTKVSQAQRDQDHDGVVNKCEFQSKSNPRRADSNHDGRRDGADDTDGDGLSNRSESIGQTNCGSKDSNHDGVTDDDENGGTILSFENGVLTIQGFAGETISGTVSDQTKIECDDGDDNAAPPVTPPTTTPPPANQVAVAHDHGDSGNGGPTGGGSNEGSGDGHSGGDDDSGEANGCTVADLLPGAVVHEADLVNGAFTKIELIK